VARFEREAKVLASLNHTNIGAIHGVEESEGQRFLILELIEGETLAERLSGGPIPVAEALRIARHIAEGLETAHENGVIHRDLKPSNVKLTPDGRVKVLDFGLAKAFAAEGSQTQMATSPTITADFTREGLVLGTAAYMSPEQARGKPLDKRTDIWSFGCVLYECLTGVRPFDGETTSDMIARILEREPDWGLLPGDMPPVVQLLLRRCLAKDLNRRLRDIGDARVGGRGRKEHQTRESTFPSIESRGSVGHIFGASRRFTDSDVGFTPTFCPCAQCPFARRRFGPRFTGLARWLAVDGEMYVKAEKCQIPSDTSCTRPVLCPMRFAFFVS
jgi:serine/threonine protein kinase